MSEAIECLADVVKGVVHEISLVGAGGGFCLLVHLFCSSGEVGGIGCMWFSYRCKMTGLQVIA